MQFKQYPSYKNSGVEWLGDVPEHWEVVKSKRLFWCKGGFAFSSDDFFEEGNYPVIRISNIQDKSISTDKIVYVNSCTKKVFSQFSAYTGDLIFCMTGASLGKVGLLPKELSFALINQRVGRLDITSYAIKQFVFYLVSNHGFQTNIRMLGVGLTDNFPNISSDLIGIIDVVLPPLDEQQGIVNYLDTETARIDNLIAKQEKLIELLEEQRKSIISHAVTKGLNPDAPMKDSGVEWLGEVPEHWEVTRLKNIGKSIIGLTYSPNEICNPDDDSYLVLRSSNVQNGQLSFLDNVYVKSYVSEKLKIKKNDILICSRNGSRDLIGKNTIIKNPPKNSTFGAFMTVYRSEHADYVYWILNSYIFKAQAGSYLTTTVNQLTINNLNNMTVPFAPTSEQNEIVEFLSTENLKFNNLISKQKALIEKLKEYRSSIISHAVTGKIDVREFGA